VTLCHINHSGPVLFESQCRIINNRNGHCTLFFYQQNFNFLLYGYLLLNRLPAYMSTSQLVNHLNPIYIFIYVTCELEAAVLASCEVLCALY